MPTMHEMMVQKGYIGGKPGPGKTKPVPPKGGGAGGKGAKPKPPGPQPKAVPPPAPKWFNPQSAHDAAVGMGFDDLPADVEMNLYRILTAEEDPAAAQAKALAYLRGTDWHKQKYVGFAAGVQTGLFGTEADYNAWKGQINDIYNQFYGRPVSLQELGSFATQGFNVTTVHQIGEGHAWAQANSADVQYQLGAFDAGQVSSGDLETLGQQYAGRGSNQGGVLQAKLQKAAAKMQRLFEGTLASPNFQLGSGGLSAPSLNPKQNQDVAR